MVKLFGICGILFGCGGIGLWFCLRLKSRVETLTAIQRGIRLLMQEIQYRAVPVRESFRAVSRQLSGEVSIFFTALAKKAGQPDGVCLAALWKEEGQTCLKDCGLKQAELEQFLAFGASLGQERKEKQMEALRLYEQYLEQQIADAKSSYENNHRLYFCLGWTGGLFLMILVI